MWDRIMELWKEKMGDKCRTLRTNNSLQCHWKGIHQAVGKFVGHYERLERNPQSGMNSNNLIKRAMEVHKNVEGSEFKFVHCWEILIKNPKWCSKHTKKNASRRKNFDINNSPVMEDSLLNTDDDIMVDGINSDCVICPEGRKSCKEKKRKLNDGISVVDALNKLQCSLDKQISVNAASLEMRRENDQKEFQLKEQLIKKEIELKENAQKLKMKAQRRQHQNCIRNQDLSKLSPSVRASYETMQAKILKEWESDGLFETDTQMQP